MTDTSIAHLTDRGLLQVAGDDAADFLQGLVTNDVEKLTAGQAAYAGLLTPQGKILFDFFILCRPGGYLIDVASGKAAELSKRLGFYKLRAKVEIENKSDAMAVLAQWGGNCGAAAASVCFADPRLAGMGANMRANMGLRIFAPLEALDSTIKDLLAASNGACADEVAYHAHRIALGVPEGGKDFAFGEAYPQDACMDQLHGVDFEKGCYVGQEVVSRMHHRGSARKRMVPVRGKKALPPPGTEIRAGTALIGTLGSTSGAKGIALLRLDRAATAIGKGDAITAADTVIKLVQPAWGSFDVPLEAS